MKYLLVFILLLACSNPIQEIEEVTDTPVMYSQDYTITIIFAKSDSIQYGSDLYYNINQWRNTPLLNTTTLKFTKSWQGSIADSLFLLQVKIKYHVWLLNNNSEKVLMERNIQTYNSIVIEEG